MKTRFPSRAAPFALALVPVALTAAAPPQPDVAAGRRLYVASGCSACHGTSGQGGGSTAPSLAPDTAPLEAFQAQLRSPANRMPRYSASVLSDDQSASYVAYLASIPPGRPPSQIPLLLLR